MRQQIAASLKNADAPMQVYLRDEIPEEYHFDDNDRIPPLVAICDLGWITWPERSMPLDGLLGAHGYDNNLPEMTATFIANGPSFVKKKELPIFENLDLYGMMATLLSIPELPNNGSSKHLSSILV